MYIKIGKKKRAERRKRALEIIKQIEKLGVTRYQITKSTWITGPMIWFWENGKHSPSERRLQSLEVFYKKLIGGGVKRESKRARKTKSKS